MLLRIWRTQTQNIQILYIYTYAFSIVEDVFRQFFWGLPYFSAPGAWAKLSKFLCLLSRSLSLRSLRLPIVQSTSSGSWGEWFFISILLKFVHHSEYLDNPSPMEFHVQAFLEYSWHLWASTYSRFNRFSREDLPADPDQIPKRCKNMKIHHTNTTETLNETLMIPWNLRKTSWGSKGTWYYLFFSQNIGHTRDEIKVPIWINLSMPVSFVLAREGAHGRQFYRT